MSRRPAASLTLAVWAAVSSACSWRTAPFTAPSPADVPGLEAEVYADSTHVEAVTALAAAYVADGRTEEARELLDSALVRLPGEPTLDVMLGLVEQELGLDERAAARFESYVQRFGGDFTDDIRARLDMVRGPTLRAEGARMVSAASDPGPPDGGVVIVVPFSHAEEDADLARGLTWLVSHSMESAHLRVSDVGRVRGMLAAMGIDPESPPSLEATADLMRLAGAAHAVRGDVGVDPNGRVSWSLTLVSIDRGTGRLTISSVPAAGALEDAPELAGRVAAIAIGLARGVRRVADVPEAEEAPTASVDALVAFGRGLGAVDEASWGDAGAGFEAASALDQSFEAAAEWSRRAEAVLDAQTVPLVSALEDAARVGELRRAVLAVRAGGGPGPAGSGADLAAQGRVEVIEVLGLDRVGGGRQVDVILQPTAGGTP